MAANWLALGALYCALSVVAGAFGAHGLRERLDVDALALWETAARYLMYGGFGLCVAGGLALEPARRALATAGAPMAVGTLIFSGTVFALAIGGPRWLGAITPIGGLGMIIGFAWMAWAAFRL